MLQQSSPKVNLVTTSRLQISLGSFCKNYNFCLRHCLDFVGEFHGVKQPDSFYSHEVIPPKRINGIHFDTLLPRTDDSFPASPSIRKLKL